MQREAARRRRSVDIPLDGFHVAIVAVVLLGIAAVAFGRAYRISHVTGAPLVASTTVPDEQTTTSAP